METRAELVRAIAGRYRTRSRLQKHRILDEFDAGAGYHRKHAIRLLAPRAATPPPPRRRFCYGPEAREALVVIWEASDRLRTKRLKPLIPVLLPALERHGRMLIDGTAASTPASNQSRGRRSPAGAGAHCRQPRPTAPGRIEVRRAAVRSGAHRQRLD
jgi:hypothetical protein